MADRKEFERIAMPELPAVYRAAVALCGRVEPAEDLVQATMVKALERFATFRPGTNCKAWLLRILRNTWIDDLRHKKVAGPAVSLDEEQLAAPPESEPDLATGLGNVLEHFGDPEIIAALAELPEAHRLTLYLVDVEQFTQEEVAEITGVAVGTVKSRTSRARAVLRAKLLDHARDLHLAGRKP